MEVNNIYLPCDKQNIDDIKSTETLSEKEIGLKNFEQNISRLKKLAESVTKSK